VIDFAPDLRRWIDERSAAKGRTPEGTVTDLLGRVRQAFEHQARDPEAKALALSLARAAQIEPHDLVPVTSPAAVRELAARRSTADR
jgi:hypothetical protein